MKSARSEDLDHTQRCYDITRSTHRHKSVGPGPSVCPVMYVVGTTARANEHAHERHDGRKRSRDVAAATLSYVVTAGKQERRKD